VSRRQQQRSQAPRRRDARRAAPAAGASWRSVPDSTRSQCRGRNAAVSMHSGGAAAAFARARMCAYRWRCLGDMLVDVDDEPPQRLPLKMRGQACLCCCCRSGARCVCVCVCVCLCVLCVAAAGCSRQGLGSACGCGMCSLGDLASRMNAAATSTAGGSGCGHLRVCRAHVLL
jgi:hypothetical protein